MLLLAEQSVELSTVRVSQRDSAQHPERVHDCEGTAIPSTGQNEAVTPGTRNRPTRSTGVNTDGVRFFVGDPDGGSAQRPVVRAIGGMP